MKKLLLAALAISMPYAALADNHSSAEDEVRDVVTAFNAAYETNEVEAYFDYYADDATVFFFGERVDMDAYHVEWAAMMEAGGGVEVNTMSDLVIQMMPGGKTAITTCFIHNKTRSPDGQVDEINAFETDVWQKMDGKWKIVSLHYTVIE